MPLAYGSTGHVAKAEFDHIVAYAEAGGAIMREAFDLSVGTFVRYGTGEIQWFDAFLPSGNHSTIEDWYHTILSHTVARHSARHGRYGHRGTVVAVRRHHRAEARALAIDAYEALHVRLKRQTKGEPLERGEFLRSVSGLLTESVASLYKHKGYPYALHRAAGLLMSNLEDDGTVALEVAEAVKDAMGRGGPFDRVSQAERFYWLCVEGEV